MKNSFLSLTTRLLTTFVLVFTIFSLTASPASAAWYDWVLDFFKGASSRASTPASYCVDGKITSADAEATYIDAALFNGTQYVTTSTDSSFTPAHTLTYPMFKGDSAIENFDANDAPVYVQVNFGANGKDLPYITQLVGYDADTAGDNDNNPTNSSPYYKDSMYEVTYKDNTLPVQKVYPIRTVDGGIQLYDIPDGYVKSIRLYAGIHLNSPSQRRDSSWIGAVCSGPNSTPPPNTPTPTITPTTAPRKVNIGDLVFVEDPLRASPNGYFLPSQGDMPLSGVTMQLWFFDGKQYIKRGATTTDDNGRYMFRNLDQTPVGSKYLVEVAPSNFSTGKLKGYNISNYIGAPDRFVCPNPSAGCTTEKNAGQADTSKILPGSTGITYHTVAQSVPDVDNLGFDFAFWKAAPTPTEIKQLSCTSMKTTATQVVPGTDVRANIVVANGAQPYNYSVRLDAYYSDTEGTVPNTKFKSLYGTIGNQNAGTVAQPIDVAFKFSNAELPTTAKSVRVKAFVEDAAARVVTSPSCEIVLDVPSTPTKVPPTVTKTPPTICVGDYVFYDTNRDGVRQSTEVGIKGVNVVLRRYDSSANQTVEMARQNTVDGGRYKFCGLSKLPANQKYFVHVSTGAFANGAPLYQHILTTDIGVPVASTCQKPGTAPCREYNTASKAPADNILTFGADRTDLIQVQQDNLGFDFGYYKTPSTPTQVPPTVTKTPPTVTQTAFSCSQMTTTAKMLDPGVKHAATITTSGGVRPFNVDFIARDADTGKVLKPWWRVSTGATGAPMNVGYTVEQQYIPSTVKNVRINSRIIDKNGRNTGERPTCQFVLPVRPGCPVNRPTAVCAPDGKSVKVSYDAIPNTAQYVVRFDANPNSWFQPANGDFAAFTSKTSFNTSDAPSTGLTKNPTTANVTPGVRYLYNLQGRRIANNGNANSAGRVCYNSYFTCTPTITATPRPMACYDMAGEGFVKDTIAPRPGVNNAYVFVNNLDNPNVSTLRFDVTLKVKVALQNGSRDFTLTIPNLPGLQKDVPDTSSLQIPVQYTLTAAQLEGAKSISIRAIVKSNVPNSLATVETSNCEISGIFTPPVVYNFCPGDPSGFEPCNDVSTDGKLDVNKLTQCRELVKTAKKVAQTVNPQNDLASTIANDTMWYTWSRSTGKQMSFCTSCGTGPLAPECQAGTGIINMQAEEISRLNEFMISGLDGVAYVYQAPGAALIDPLVDPAVDLNDASGKHLGLLRRSFTANATGNYRVAMKVKAVNGKSDSLYINIVPGTTGEIPKAKDLWNNIPHSSAFVSRYVRSTNQGNAILKVPMVKGETYTLTILGREPNTQIDELSLLLQ